MWMASNCSETSGESASCVGVCVGLGVRVAVGGGVSVGTGVGVAARGDAHEAARRRRSGESRCLSMVALLGTVPEA
jgi:hypothetical protein